VRARAGSQLAGDLGWPLLGEEGKEEEKKLTGGTGTSVRERESRRAG
jgi:hypothetical protein